MAKNSNYNNMPYIDDINASTLINGTINDQSTKYDDNKKKKKRAFTWWQVLGLLVAFALLCYPLIAEIRSAMQARSEIENYTYTVEEKTAEEITYLLENAHAFNNRLSGTPDDYKEKILPYEDQIESGGIAFAWIELPKLGESLPIYHGVGNDELQSGVGHLPTSSLPVGGENTHAILLGHSGMPGSRMFDDIENLDNGDIIFVHVLNEVLAYKVDNKKVVWPDEVNDLKIEKGKDQITLVTCTPYGVNDHRLLVNALRTEYDGNNTTVIKAPPDPEGILAVLWNRRTIPIWIGFGVVILFFGTMGIMGHRRKKKKKQKEKEQTEAQAIAEAKSQRNVQIYQRRR